MKLAIGCPIRERAWIFPDWVEHVRAATQNANVEYEWAFVLPASGDKDGTTDMVNDLLDHEPGYKATVEEPPLPSRMRNGRLWDTARFEHMVVLRNRLLSLVQSMEPEYFLSVDSDILLHPFAIRILLDTIENVQRNGNTGQNEHWDAVGGKVYLSKSGDRCPSYAMVNSGHLIRSDSDTGVFRVDAIMALKLMNAYAYQTRYDYHFQGEDIGWSQNATAAGLKLGWNANYPSKHCMTVEALDTIDPRIGW